MTQLEAVERAHKIWGESALGAIVAQRVKPYFWAPERDARWPGAVDWNPEWRIETSRHQPLHYLDANGHAICHEACARLEQAAYQ